jgi:acyl dehydratase
MDSAGFKTPVEDRYLEDYVPGSVHEFGRITVEEDEIIAFGRQIDPQIFHTDPEDAKSTIYGGLIASTVMRRHGAAKTPLKRGVSHETISLGSDMRLDPKRLCNVTHDQVRRQADHCTQARFSHARDHS